jgi:hypothetical protein
MALFGSRNIPVATVLFLISLIAWTKTHAQPATLSVTIHDLHFEWDLPHDQARLYAADARSPIWTGSLLPAFWLQDSAGRHYVHARFRPNGILSKNDNHQIPISLDGYGHGTLIVTLHSWGLSFDSLIIQWQGNPPAIIDLYLGTSFPPEETSNMLMGDRPYLPDWQSAGYCVPGAREGATQSYFRNWDFDQAEIALGSFGPSMGSPYAAAFPRPLLFAGMGNDKGWVCFGAGSVPDATKSEFFASY